MENSDCKNNFIKLSQTSSDYCRRAQTRPQPGKAGLRAQSGLGAVFHEGGAEEPQGKISEASCES